MGNEVGVGRIRGKGVRDAIQKLMERAWRAVQAFPVSLTLSETGGSEHGDSVKSFNAFTDSLHCCRK